MKPTSAASRRAAAFTLLEVMLSMFIFSVVLLLAFDMMGRGSEHAALGSQRAYVQANAQLALAQVSRALRESTPAQVRIATRTEPPGGTIVLEDGQEVAAEQSFICFPIPRDAEGEFAFHDGAGAVLGEPRWQGIAVVALHEGTLWEYVQFGTDLPFGAVSPIDFDTITDTTITLTDGTTFDRAGEAGTGQRTRVLLRGAAHLETGATAGDPRWLVLRAVDRLQSGRISGDGGGTVVSASFATGVLARNKN